jgi:hypothetical protein
MTKKNNVCHVPGCTKPGEIPVKDGKWMCIAHVHERVNSPENVARMELQEADEELQEFRDGGGNLS